jgi:HB1, ASXL, restriction endonuclease HTH domain
MSKKMTTTSKPEVTRPSVIPIMRSRGGKAKAKVGDAPTTDTSAAADAATNGLSDQRVPTSEAPSIPAAPMTHAPDATPADGAGTTKKRKAAAAKEPKKMSCLDAAAKVLADGGIAMTTGEMIEAMAKKKLWSSPNGQTPSATLYSAILRELKTKGKDARFKKTERGKFTAKA